MQQAKTRDPLWWVHPDIRTKVFDLDGILEFPEGSVLAVDSDDPSSDDPRPISIEHGEFSSLGSLLYMINGHRPGPIQGFYVVVEAKKGEAWCVGQMHADSVSPLRVFVNKRYGSEAAARQAAERMRVADRGNTPPHMN